MRFKLAVIVAAALITSSAMAADSRGATATFTGESVSTSPNEIGPDDVSLHFDLRNDTSEPIAEIGFKCALHLPDRTVALATITGKYKFEHVVQPGDTRHEDLAINEFSDFGQTAQNLQKDETVKCVTLDVITASGNTITPETVTNP